MFGTDLRRARIAASVLATLASCGTAVEDLRAIKASNILWNNIEPLTQQ